MICKFILWGKSSHKIQEKKTCEKTLYPMMLAQKNCFERAKTNHLSFCTMRQLPEQLVWIKVCFEIPFIKDSYRNQSAELQCWSFHWFLMRIWWKEFSNRFYFIPANIGLDWRYMRCSDDVRGGCVLNVLYLDFLFENLFQ